MATHELPDWEGPSPAAPKRSIFRKPIPTAMPVPPASQLDGARSFFGPEKGGEPSSTAFDKETAVESSPAPIPQRRKYCGLSPRILILIAVVSALLLALIIGLAVGLSRRSHSQAAQDLPLPSNTNIFTGDLTYYSPGPGYGACGYQNTSTEAICAISHIVWDAELKGGDSNDNPLCGKHIRITRFDESVGGNRSVDVEVVDRCVGCKATDLDLSLKMFTSLAEEAQGRVVGSWAWL